MEIPPELSDGFGDEGRVYITFHEEIEAGATARDLVIKLSTKYKRFAELVFNAETQKLTGAVIVLLNDRFLDLSQGLETEIGDGDRITFLQAFSGG